METAVLLDERVFKEAEREADNLRVSVPDFCGMAIREFVGKLHGGTITEQVNAVYSHYQAKIDDDILQAQYDLVGEEDW